jgi:lysophospholipase L1-like esterase
VSASDSDRRSPAARRRTLLLGLFSLVVVAAATLVLTELAARFYTYRILQREPRYETDAKLGWRMRPNLATRRRLSESHAYDLFTDGQGYRIAEGERGDVVAGWRASAGPRILVLGDSFAEGFVDIQDRFDRVLTARHPDWAVLTLGCGGYSVDQEMIAGRAFFDDLRAGDVLLLLTCGNDFEEVLTQSYSARARPYFTLEQGRLAEHLPAIGIRERLRDASYVASVVLLRLSKAQTSFTPAEREQARQLYAAIVRAETGRLVDRGVRVVIAHHTDWLGGDNADVFRLVCDERGIFELALDPHVIGDGRDRNPNLLEDGTHWSARGNVAAAAALEPFLARLLTNP